MTKKKTQKKYELVLLMLYKGVSVAISSIWYVSLKPCTRCIDVCYIQFAKYVQGFPSGVVGLEYRGCLKMKKGDKTPTKTEEKTTSQRPCNRPSNTDQPKRLYSLAFSLYLVQPFGALFAGVCAVLFVLASRRCRG